VAVTRGREQTATSTREPVRARLVHVFGAAAAVVMTGTAVGLRDIDAMLVSVAVIAALLWLWLRPQSLLAAAVVVIVLADVVYFTGGAAISNLSHGEGIVPIALPGSVAVTSLIALLAATAVMAFPGWTRMAPLTLRPSHAAGAGALTGVVIAIVMLVAPQLHTDKPRPGDVAVTMSLVSYHPKTLRVRQGPATLFVANHDLFWHTFTVDKLHVDVGVPTGGARRVGVSLPPGRYVYYCRVPGHRAAGMKGTLIVS